MTPQRDFGHDSLKERQRSIRDDVPAHVDLRVHRALSWLKRAELCETEDTDSTFIFLWISFNAAYACDIKEQMENSERSIFDEYFKKLRERDSAERRIYDAIWERFSSSIRAMMDNHYVYQPFWRFKNQEPGFENWEERFKKSKDVFRNALRHQNTGKMLSCLFDRLYVLRNQVMHGGATWEGEVNRDQLRDGVEILGFLVPVFIGLMMDNPDEDWGKPYYPVVE